MVWTIPACSERPVRSKGFERAGRRAAHTPHAPITGCQKTAASPSSSPEAAARNGDCPSGGNAEIKYNPDTGTYEYTEGPTVCGGDGDDGSGDPYNDPYDDPFDDPWNDEGGGGSDSSDDDETDDECDPQAINDPDCESQLQNLITKLASEPYALLDVPCDQIPAWSDLAQHDVPQSVVDRLQNTDALSGSQIQRLAEAAGAVSNLDFFGVTVPLNQLPNGWSPEQYLEHIRTNINDYIDTGISRFDFYPGLPGEEERWLSNNPLGTIFNIQLTPNYPELFDEDGSVVASSYSPSYWIFSTLWTSDNRYHPVSGNRRFVFRNNDNGTATIYTRGADRLSTHWYHWANTLLGEIAFDTADDLWTSFQNGIAQHFGGASIGSPVTYRPNYDDVSSVVNGQTDPSTIGCHQITCLNYILNFMKITINTAFIILFVIGLVILLYNWQAVLFNDMHVSRQFAWMYVVYVFMLGVVPICLVFIIYNVCIINDGHTNRWHTYHGRPSHWTLYLFTATVILNAGFIIYSRTVLK